MWEFLLQEIVDPVTGLIERDRIKAKGLSIWEKFRTEMNDKRTATSLRKRYSMPNFPSPQSMNFDVDSQVKLHYALGIPVDDVQLNELIENADVDLDEYSCIVRYKDRRLGGLELRQFVRHRRKKREDPMGLEEFLAAKMHKIDENAEINNEIFEEIKEEEASRDSSLSDEQAIPNLWSLLGGAGARQCSSVENALLNALKNPEKLIKLEDVTDEPAGPSDEPVASDPPPTHLSSATYLESMNSLITSIGSPELEGVQQKIREAMEQEKKIPIEKVKMMMEATLAMMGF